MASNDQTEAPKGAKPGFKTSEFWLNLLVVILGALMMSGALADGSMITQIVGGALSLLGSLGYTVGRVVNKKAADLGNILNRPVTPSNDNLHQKAETKQQNLAGNSG